MQTSLPGLGPPPPEGLVYVPRFLAPEEERALVSEVARLEYGEFRMHGVVARRRVVYYGYGYGADRREITRVEAELPPWLLALRARCATLAGTGPERLAQVLVAMYPPGAGVGWHRDAPQFGRVVGVSLGTGCRMRFRKQGGGGSFERWETWLAPGSAYVLAGPARTRWQHEIPPVRTLRWSITFRTVRDGPAATR